MVGEHNPEDVWIKQGCSLIFEASKEGGVEWRMRNTAQGLLIETEGRPLLRLTPDKVLVRGDLSVDGEIGRAFDLHKFEGVWEVKTGDIGHPETNDPPPPYYAIVKLEEDGRFQLYSREGENGQEIPRQKLRYNPRTGTLDDADSGGPERCISFWDCKTRGGDANRIFAMRMKKEGGVLGEDFYCPWEKEDEDGSWGAQEG